jgi:S1-C subfamily serine protease
MKKTVLLMLAIALNINVFSQEPKTQNELRKYFQNNILNLQPFEGVYSVIVHSWSSMEGRWKNVTHQWGMYYSNSDRKYHEYRFEDSGKLTEMRAYRYDPQTHILSHSNGSFPCRVGNPENFILEEDRTSSIGFYYKREYTKIYPTSEMYAEAATPKEWSGTGFALKEGYLITNYHVIDGAGNISIQGVNGNFNLKLNATVVASDRANDIALLKIYDSRFTGFGNIPYQLRTTLADVGESVYALGYPLANVMGDEIKFTDGKISSKTGYQGAVNVYQISVPIQPGNSGGPLFDQKGNIVGITTASLNKDMFGSENVNYAVKTAYIMNLIDSSVGRKILPTGTTLRNMNLTQQIKAAQNFVFYISCKK